MKKLMSLAIGVGLLSVPALAMAVTLEGHFSGHADNSSGVGGSYVANGTYDVYMTLNQTQTNPWYPWNAAKEYTAVLSTTISSYNVFGNLEVVDFGVAAVTVYEDDATPANYGNLATFTDGTAILSGGIQNMIGNRVTIFGLPFDVTGVVVFDGGAGLANLDAQCSEGLVMNDFIDFTFATNPPGFEEAYDAEWKCPDSTGLDATTWGRVKDLYR
ncbi:MAG: hypothetical protein R3B81_04515 [bacterium]